MSSALGKTCLFGLFACACGGPPSEVPAIPSPPARTSATATATASAAVERWQPFRDGRATIASDAELAVGATCLRNQIYIDSVPARAAAIVPARRARRLAEAPSVALFSELARGDYAAVARRVDPAIGLCVRGSPGGSCVALDPAELRGCRSSTVVREWGWQSANEASTEATCGVALETLVGPGFATARPLTFNCPDVIAFSATEDSIATLYVQTFVGDPRVPWRALTLGFIERDEALLLTEITAAHWLP